MQAGGKKGRASRNPRRRWRLVLSAVAAFVLFAAAVALLVNTVPVETSRLGAEDASTNVVAGSAAIHDDAGDTNRYSYPLRSGMVTELEAGASSAVIHDDAANLVSDLGGAVVHDDAGNVVSQAGAAVIHDDAGGLIPGAGIATVHDDAGNMPQ